MNSRLITAIWILAALLLVTAALVTMIAAVDDGLLILAVAMSVVVLATTMSSRTSRTPLPTIDTERATALRTQRDNDGEVAAIHSLRSSCPDLSLLAATKLVRSL